MAHSGRVPDGYQVHHRIPLDDSGINTPSNYILMRSDIEHRAVHGYYNAAELRIRLLVPGQTATVAMPLPPMDTVVYPNAALGYVACDATNSAFLETFDVS